MTPQRLVLIEERAHFRGGGAGVGRREGEVVTAFEWDLLMYGFRRFGNLVRHKCQNDKAMMQFAEGEMKANQSPLKPI